MTLSLAPSAYVALQCPQPGVIGQRYVIFIDGEAVPVVLDARASANAAWYCGGNVGRGRVRLQVSALDERHPQITPPTVTAPRPTVTAMPVAPRVATTLRH